MQQQGILPNANTYNTLVCNCDKGEDLRQLFQILLMMQRQGIVPEVDTYNALIGGCAEGKQHECAVEVFCTLLLQALVPTVVTCGSSLALAKRETSSSVHLMSS